MSTAAEQSNLVPLFRKVIRGAAVASLDIAGSALLPGGWPILKAALGPVLDRLSERFMGRDVTSSPELAEQAAAEFARDARLQELLRTNLLDALDPVVKSGARVEEDVQTLCLMAMGNAKALDRIAADVGDISTRLDRGVALSKETMEELCALVEARLDASRNARNFALGQIGPAPFRRPPWLSLDEIKESVNEAEVEAVGLVREGQNGAAMARLRDAQMLLAHALEETPTDATLKVLQGYVFKAQAQAVDGTSSEDAQRYLSLANDAFELVLEDVPSDSRSLDETASAINGLANIYAGLGQFEKAIDLSEHATSLRPGYAYAWHDLFAAYAALASGGSLNLERMRNAYAGLCATAAGVPGLNPSYLKQLGERLRDWEGQS